MNEALNLLLSGLDDHSDWEDRQRIGFKRQGFETTTSLAGDGLILKAYRFPTPNGAFRSMG